MKSIELLQQHPLSREVIRSHFIKKMLKEAISSFQPGEIDEKFVSENVNDDTISIFIDSFPRGLFDVFDSQRIYIEILLAEGWRFEWRIGELRSPRTYATRSLTENAAIEQAFITLEKKLQEKDSGDTLNDASQM